jgi:hypothetical protein
MKTSAKLKNENLILEETFKSVSQLINKLEDSVNDWHLAPLWGHTGVHKLCPFYSVDIATLQAHRINTVSQLFDTHLSGGIDKTVSLAQMN